MNGRPMIERWEDDNKIFLQVNIKNKLLPTLYGGIVGDCLGVPVEFKPRGSYLLEDMIGYGTYNQPEGTWSDDSSLTFCLMENMIHNDTTDNLMLKFQKYKTEGYMTPYGKMFDIGRTTSEAINRFENGIDSQLCGGKDEFDNGNGAVMRISPLAFELFDNFNFLERVARVKEITEITHSHPRAIVGSIIYIELLIRLFHNNSLQVALERVNKLFHENFSNTDEYFKEFKSYSQIFETDFLTTDINKIKSSGYIIDTLEAAIWCFGNTKSFESATLLAANLGGDTDTISSITGSLAGIFYKLEGIPEHWLYKIANKEKVDKLINKFMLKCTEDAISRAYDSKDKM